MDKTPPEKWHSAIYTFSHAAEGHVGAEIVVSEAAKKGETTPLSLDDLKKMQARLPGSKIINLHRPGTDDPQAWVLHAPNGVFNLSGVTAKELFDEVKGLGLEGIDRQYKCPRRKKVLNKLARGNFNVADKGHRRDIENFKNTLYSFEKLPMAQTVRSAFDKLAHETGVLSLQGMLAEANIYYHDGCGIRYHGDDERDNSPVVGTNMGHERYIMWRPFFKHRIVGEETMIKLSPGDIYAMSKSAVGVGWMRDTHKRIIYRHRAGSKTFLQRHDTELKKRYGKTYQSTKFTCSSIQDALKPAAELRIKRHRSDLGVTPQRPEKQSKKRKAADGSVRKF